jgi:hypothetical protein
MPFFNAPGKLNAYPGRHEDGVTVDQCLPPSQHALGNPSRLDIGIEVR